MQLPVSPNNFAIPAGLPSWLAAFVSQALGENRTLVENGAAQAVAARLTLLNSLIAAAKEYFDEEITVQQAADLLQKHPETIRRAVRSGALPERRDKPRARLRIRRGDLDALAAPQIGAYDPIADAHGIAQRRRE